MPAAGGQAGSRRANGSSGVDEDSAERVKRYRDNAAEIYAVVVDVTHLPSRAALLRLAETYERLASRLEADWKDSKGAPDLITRSDC
jgi:hypothetical protein